MLLPSVVEPPDPGRQALGVGDRAFTYRQLRTAAAALGVALRDHERVAIWATPTLETCVGVVAALLWDVTAVPLNPKLGPRELEHVLVDSAPSVVLAAEDEALPEALRGIPRLALSRAAPDGGSLPNEPDGERPAFVFYTSGTTGPPKGVLMPRRAIASNLDALADAWGWTADDILTHGLPLFHVHGLVLGVLGPLRVGGSLHHVGRFSPGAICDQVRDGATMVFGVPTMYHALAEEVERDPAAADALSRARLLVSGSAPLPVRELLRIERATGLRIVERYGLTETIMNCATRADGARTPGTVGPPLPGVEIRLVDEAGVDLDPAAAGGGEDGEDEPIGEVVVRGPNLFLGYLNRPDDTAAVMRDGWFYTGDLATRTTDGSLRIVGRRATDLIKTGGYKVGAGEVEAALMEHPAVREVAVTGEPDERLGECIVAWVVLREADAATPQDLEDHVASLLAPHKRPRRVRFVDALPRNEMGKVRKAALPREGPGP